MQYQAILPKRITSLETEYFKRSAQVVEKTVGCRPAEVDGMAWRRHGYWRHFH